MRYWYQAKLHLSLIPLLPLTALFRSSVAVRRTFYRNGIFKSTRLPVPVIIVGNIAVGGTGKTPFVIWLCNFLRTQGFKPGIISRGVGGKKHIVPHIVNHEDRADIVGDEALVLINNAQSPVVLCIDRVAAAKKLLQDYACDFIISDDGLQHYRLQRDVEIAIIDGKRRLGNKLVLPAGPLREPPQRLQQVDFAVVNGGVDADEFTLSLQPKELLAVSDPNQKKSFAALPQQKVHAIAGIGNPERFFTMLRELGFDVIPHEFPDHYLYSRADIHFKDDLPVLMTEKDAVKCRAFATERHWYVPVVGQVNAALEEKLLAKIRDLAGS